ncbi:hypothetical protein BGZ96_001790 [Linnemannia gamsii]|uniref:Uncharacterized protein n=1 Tax=Linnemannia gamsii TaxID=64522 RepID=A0ABQ7KAE9_9FUNG|nr:hypothetical protein BGZ96_001790 [Linnemannia gamsii]
MGTTKSVAPAGQQHHTLTHQSSNSNLNNNNSNRSSLKASTNQVRWPVSLNQLAAISLDDDSDFDRSLTDVSKDDIGSVKLLKMLKDSDDESVNVREQSRLRRPRSTFGSLQTGQQKSLLQQQQQGGAHVSRSSSMHNVHGSQMPRPQRTRSDIKGSSGLPPSGSSTRPAGLQNHQSNASLVATKRLSRTGGQPDDMEQIYSEAQALAQRLGNSSSDPRAGGLTRANSSGIRVPGGMRNASGMSSSSSSSSISRIAAASTDGASMLRRPTSIPAPNSPSSGISNIAVLPPKSSARLSISSKLPATSTSTLKHRASLSSASASSRQEIKQVGSINLSREQDAPSPSRIPGSPSAIQQTTAARKLASLQQSPLTARPNNLRQNASDNHISTALLPTPPMSTSSDLRNDSQERKAVKEMEEELARWKMEVRELRHERAATDGWRKQISDLERDLETALDSLQSAEAKVIELRSEQQSTAADKKDHEDAQEKLTAYEATVQQLKAELELVRGEKEKALEDATTSQKEQLAQLEASNQELEQKLTQAQQEIEQLELQAAPPEVQEVQQSLFSATQDLEESKLLVEKLRAELTEEKAKIAREQEDAGQLLVKLSQLQDTIANQLRENNTLKDVVKDHEKCTDNAETVEYQHKKETMQLQKEIMDHQKAFEQEKEQKTALEMAIQEHQYQTHQFQQQFQLQQTQLLQQQSEIVNLRASLEIEQKQSSLWQQRHQEEQRLNHASSFGRRVSLDYNGDINGSFTMDSSATSSSAIGVPTGIPGAGLGLMNMGLSLNMGMAMGGAGADNNMSSSPLTSTPPNMLGGPLGQGGPKMSMLSNQINMSNNSAAALPPSASLPPVGGMASIGEVEVKPRMIHRISSGSINNRHSMHGDMFFGSSASSTVTPATGPFQTVDELTAQLHGLMKEKERLQADLSKIPISGGGPMMRRKAEMLEEQMDETERMMSKIRYSIRMRS